MRLIQIKTAIVATLLCVFGIAFGFTGVVAASSAPNNSSPVTNVAAGLTSDACAGLKQLNNAEGCGSGGNKFKRVITSIVRILSYLIGAVAVIMIIVAGFRYVTSAGSPEGVGAAKNTLIYAVIGLIVAVLAQMIVRVVLKAAN